MSLYSQLDRLASDLEAVKTQLNAVANTNQLQRTSVEGGAIEFNDEDGNLMASMGGQDDGSNTIRHVDGPTPPVPSGLSAHVDGPIVQVSWDGTFEDADTATWDWSHLEVVVVGPSNEQLTATINDVTGASTSVAATVSGEWTVVARSVSRAEKRSLDGDAGTVDVELVGLTGAINDAIGSANGKNTVTYAEVAPTPADEGVLGDTWFVNQVNTETGTMLITEQWQYVTEWVQTELNHQVIATVDLGKATVGELDGIRIMGQTIHGEQLSGDAIDGKVITGANIRTSGSGARVQMDVGGLRVFDASDDQVVQLPSDGTAATFNGELVAKSLTSTGRASFLAENNRLEPGAGLVLAAGVGDPPSPPVVSNHYKQITPPALVEGESVSGLAYGGGLFWRAIDAGSGNNSNDRIEGIDRNGVTQRTIPLVNFWARNGLAVIGDELFALGIRDDRPENVRNQERWVRVFGLDGTYKRQWEYPNYGTGTYQPGIGSTPAGNVSIAQCWVDGKLSWRTFSPTGTFINITTRDAPVKSDAVGIYGGTADFGATRTVFAKGFAPGTNRQFTVYGANGNDYYPEQSWYSPGRGDVKGLAWDGEKFYSIDPAGVITEYGSLNMGDDSANWWATYRWVGSGGKTTRIAPPARFAWARRSRLRVSAPNLPQGVTTIEPSLAFKTTTPTRSEFRSPAWAAGATPSTVNYEVLPTSWQSGAAPGDINNFPNSTPSSVKASTGLFEVRGDGSGRWGPLTFNPDGSMSSSAVPAWVPITAFASGFSAGSFGFAPAYRVWPDGKVEWRGTVEGNVTAYSHDAFTIPSAALPTQAVQGEVATSAGTGAAPALTRCEFRPESATTKFRVYQGGTNRSWFSLDQNWYYKS